MTTPSQGTFPGLLTFLADGSVIALESPSPFQSSMHGTWVENDGGGVAFTFGALFGSEEGKNTGRSKVFGRLQFDPRTASCSGPFKVEVFDAGGQVTFSDRGTLQLTRIEVEPLE